MMSLMLSQTNRTRPEITLDFIHSQLDNRSIQQILCISLVNSEIWMRFHFTQIFKIGVGGSMYIYALLCLLSYNAITANHYCSTNKPISLHIVTIVSQRQQQPAPFMLLRQHLAGCLQREGQ